MSPTKNPTRPPGAQSDNSQSVSGALRWRTALSVSVILSVTAIFSGVPAIAAEASEVSKTTTAGETKTAETAEKLQDRGLSQGQALRFDEQIQLLVRELSPSLVSVQIASETDRASDLSDAVGAEMDLSHVDPILLRSISALVIDTGGYLLCAASMLGEDDSMFLRIAGGQVPVERVGIDYRSGLALLRASTGQLAPVQYSDRSPGVGAVALFLSANVGGVEPLITISGPNRMEGYLEFSGPSGAGVAGGAFFDMNGALLAVALGSLDESGASNRIFATPISRIKPIVSRLMCCGDRSAGYLGVQVISTEVRGLSRERLREPAFKSSSVVPAPSVHNAAFAVSEFQAPAERSDESIKGALLTVVESGSPAELSGLRIGDVVFACDDQPIENAETFRDYIRGCRPDSLIEITSLRGLTQQSRTIRIAASPRQSGFQPAVAQTKRRGLSAEDENASLRKVIMDLQRRVESLEKRVAEDSRP